MTYGKCMLCGILWGVATFIVLLVVLLALLPPSAKADDGRNCAAVSRLIVMPHGVSVDAGDGGAIFILKRDVRFDEAGPLRVCWGAAQRPVLYMPSDAWPQFAGRVHLAQATDADRAAKLKWIHENVSWCCNHFDCAPATLVWTPLGWRAIGADNVIPFGDKADVKWPFPEPYACIIGRYLRCVMQDTGL